MVTCDSCGSENKADHSFCSNCGSALRRACPSCGTENEPQNNFCFNCGAGLSGVEAPQVGVTVETDPVSDPGERRLVSVMFADLVGFTTYSEGRDPEDVRDMLTHFYEECREIVGRHGGETDKFIGDAVMGVWGAVEANEDDAERATRAALELVDMVEGLGRELGVPELAARAGVLSGPASVGSGGNDKGLVVGDLVNTASRLQSLAPAGGVYVGGATRDLVGNAIEFRSVGEQQVKGKEQPVDVFEAVRVLALSTARTSADVLEGPFVGRDDELRLLKDQLHATGRDSRARMVSIMGEAGIGKSRLAVELIRYIDGIEEVIYYHQGRSPSYGDGVSFWALGEMIRQRAGITEGEDAAKARMKLRTTVAEFVPTEEDRLWIEPRLAAVLGLAPSPPGERAEHFAALRSFFQAIARRGTVLMVFEDLHWADEGLLDFIEELVERTTSDPILILCLARPELLERRRDWAIGRKRTLSMHLSRLDEESMRELLAGLAPGLPPAMVDRIAERTAGVPLHAVEFVRMLLNSGQLIRGGDGFEFAGSEEQMPIPDSVSAIIGARIDRLDSAAQSILRDASVLGLTFSLPALSELQEKAQAEIEPVLQDLVRREVLEFDENPRSPERGQYRFLQGLIREVTYGRLSRQERVTRHLAVAEMFDRFEDPELAGVIASHYADAVDADPGNEELVGRACDAVVEAAERAVSLKSDAQAALLYERAAPMTSDAGERDSLRLEAASCFERTGRADRGVTIAREVLAQCRDRGDRRGEMRALTTLVRIQSANFEAGEAADLALDLYENIEPTADPDWIALAEETSKVLMLAERTEESIQVAEAVIPMMEDLEMVEELLDTLISKGSALTFSGGMLEGAALLLGVAAMAEDRGLLHTRLRALNNLGATTQYDKPHDPVAYEVLDGLAERIGDENWAVRSHFFASLSLTDDGQLDEALERISAAEELDLSEFWADSIQLSRLRAEVYGRGPDEESLERMFEIWDKYADTDDPQLSSAIRSQRARILFDFGRLEEALAVGKSGGELKPNYPYGIEAAVFSAALLRDKDSLEELQTLLGERHPRGRACRGLARMATAFLLALAGDHQGAEREFLDGEELWANTVALRSIACASAVVAVLLGPETEFGSTKGEQARQLFEDNGLQVYLDVLMSEVPASIDSSDLAV